MKHFGLLVDVAERVGVVEGAAAEQKGERRLGLQNVYSGGTRTLLDKNRAHIGGHLERRAGWRGESSSSRGVEVEVVVVESVGVQVQTTRALSVGDTGAKGVAARLKTRGGVAFGGEQPAQLVDVAHELRVARRQAVALRTLVVDVRRNVCMIHHRITVDYSMGYTPLVIFICVAFLFMLVNMHWLVVFPLFRDGHRVLSVALGLLYSGLWGMSTYTYRLTIEVPAGTPPLDYVPPDADEATLRAERAKQMAESSTLSPIEPEFERMSERRFGAVRFCRPCAAFKPPRSHHCQQCRHCVLLYDHHCPFIGQCLGYYNRKVFQLFLLYTVLGATLSLVLYLWRLVSAAVDLQHSQHSSDPFDTHGSLYLVSALVLVVIQLFVVLVVVFSVGSLMIHQINMLLNNTTTVEYHQYRTERYEAGRSFRWRHDLGSGLQNLKACMGQSVPGMFWPSVPTGNGFSASDRDAA